ncbi:MAG: hypothetical protein ABIQ95_07530 [Bdellovibrionia bacterium]
MLHKYLFIPVIVGILGCLSLWSHSLDSKVETPHLSQKPVDLKLLQPRRILSTVNSSAEPKGLEFEPQDLEIEALESN